MLLVVLQHEKQYIALLVDSIDGKQDLFLRNVHQDILNIQASAVFPYSETAMPLSSWTVKGYFASLNTMWSLCMLHSEEQCLQFHCGPFVLLLPVSGIIKILDFDRALCSPSGDSLTHHGQSTDWNDTTLPYLDLRLVLQLPHEQLRPPSSALVLRNSSTFQPIGILAVDEVIGFVEPRAHEWYQASGINPNIDIF